MKKLFIVLLILAFVVPSAYAHGKSKTTVVKAEEDFNVAGVKIDAPNLVNITKDGAWTLGAEGGKDIIRNIFYSDNAYYEADRGYFAYAKITYNGCLLRCSEE